MIEEDVDGLVQGFGFTENGELPGVLLETKVTTLSNQDCQLLTNKSSGVDKAKLKLSLPLGVTNGILCTKGILNNKTGIYSVSL